MTYKTYKTFIFIILSCVLCACNANNTQSYMQFPHMPMLRSNDDQIIELIQNRYHTDPTLETTPINIESYKGNVKISGYVKTIKQSDIAETLAMNTPGVLNVQNLIIVRK